MGLSTPAAQIYDEKKKRIMIKIVTPFCARAMIKLLNGKYEVGELF